MVNPLPRRESPAVEPFVPQQQVSRRAVAAGAKVRLGPQPRYDALEPQDLYPHAKLN